MAKDIEQYEVSRQFEPYLITGCVGTLGGALVVCPLVFNPPPPNRPSPFFNHPTPLYSKPDGPDSIAVPPPTGLHAFVGHESVHTVAEQPTPLNYGTFKKHFK